MRKIKCYDFATAVTDEVTKLLHGSKREDAGRKRIFEELCGIIDELSDRFDGGEININIDQSSLKILVELDCLDPEVGSPEDNFFRLVSMSEKFSVTASETIEDGVKIGFVLDGFWV